MGSFSLTSALIITYTICSFFITLTIANTNFKRYVLSSVAPLKIDIRRAGEEDVVAKIDLHFEQADFVDLQLSSSSSVNADGDGLTLDNILHQAVVLQGSLNFDNAEFRAVMSELGELEIGKYEILYEGPEHGGVRCELYTVSNPGDAGTEQQDSVMLDQADVWWPFPRGLVRMTCIGFFLDGVRPANGG